MEQERILVVDDDEGLLHLLRMRLSALGFSVTPCTEGRDALTAARQETFDIAIPAVEIVAENFNSLEGMVQLNLEITVKSNCQSQEETFPIGKAHKLLRIPCYCHF